MSDVDKAVSEAEAWEAKRYSAIVEPAPDSVSADIIRNLLAAVRELRNGLNRVGKVVGCPRDDAEEIADATEVVFGSLRDEFASLRAENERLKQDS